MKAPDVIYCGADWFYRDSVIRGEVPIVCDTNKNEGDVEYIRLDKVKELIEGNIKKYEALADGKTANFSLPHTMKARAMESLLEQLEGLE